MVGTVVLDAASSMALLGDRWPLTAGLVLVAVCVLLLSVDSVWRDLAQEGGLIWALVVAVWAGTNLVSRAHAPRSEEHTSELQSRFDIVCRLLLEKKKKRI